MNGEYPLPDSNGVDMAIDEVTQRIYTSDGGVYGLGFRDMRTLEESFWHTSPYGTAAAVVPGSEFVFGGSSAAVTQFRQSDGATVAT